MVSTFNPRCEALESLGAKIHIGSQEDRGFLRLLREEIPRMDVLIDNGGHTMKQQRTTFEEMYPHLREGGVYICEDLHTSHSLRYGSGYRRRGSIIEFSKHLIDDLHKLASLLRRYADDREEAGVKAAGGSLRCDPDRGAAPAQAIERSDPPRRFLDAVHQVVVEEVP